MKLSFGQRLKLHVFVLSRPFALPAVACGVTLGCLRTEASGMLTVLAILCAAAAMAWGHSMNTLLDYALGMDNELTKPKAYSLGNQVIVRGMMKSREVMVNAAVWLVISLVLAVVISSRATPWIFLPWGVMISMTFLYSVSKRYYLCETVLALAGSCAVLIGAAAGESFVLSDFGPAWMSGLAFAWVFGFGAEFMDQAFDADADQGKNMGGLARSIGVHPVTFMTVLLCLAYIIQIALVIGGFLAPLTLSTLAVMPLFVYCIMAICVTKPDGEQSGIHFNNKAIMAAMMVMFLWMLTLVISQAVAP